MKRIEVKKVKVIKSKDSEGKVYHATRITLVCYGANGFDVKIETGFEGTFTADDKDCGVQFTFKNLSIHGFRECVKFAKSIIGDDIVGTAFDMLDEVLVMLSAKLTFSGI